MIGTNAKMIRTTATPPSQHDPKQHQIQGPIHSWDAPVKKQRAKARKNASAKKGRSRRPMSG
jgi:hypothetical protein